MKKLMALLLVLAMVAAASCTPTKPTTKPTDAPTTASTAAPTEKPTDAPTTKPTDAPTTAPTDAPTDAPTAAPTDEPTAAPTDEPTAAPTDAPTEAPSESEPAGPVEGKVLSYAEYAAAELDTSVTVETYVQAKQSWWDNKATFYTQDEDGAYFIYEMACTKEQYDALVPGTKIRVTGYKAEWSGEVEITDAKFEVIPGSYIAEPVDVTALLGTEELIGKQNQYVTFKGLTIAAYDVGDVAFAYKNAEEKTDDLYFKATLGEEVYGFCVEFYLCGKDTDVYKAVENMKVGDVVDITGYLYWYNGMNPHVTAISAAAPADSVMSYAEYAAAELDTKVTVETYVQAKQSWWDNKATFYTQDEDGAYFIYEMPCTQEQYDALVPGTKIRVSGYKAEWSGEVEITDATFEVIPGSFIAEAQDVTELLGTDDLIGKQNQYVTFKGLTIAAYDEDGAAFAYKNAEEKSDDLYFKATLGENTYSFCVEYYLCGKDTDVYKAVEGLKVGDKVDITGYLYWYNGMNPHVTAISTESAPAEGKVMSYAEYAAAELDTAVTVETYVQAKQSWWDNKATFYTQDEDGAYFIYEMACTKEQYDALVPGTKIRVSGYKAEWSGEVEITDAKFEVIPGSFIAEPADVTELLGTDGLIGKQNQYVTFKGMTIVAYDEEGAAFAYKNAEEKSDDLYFKASHGENIYSFCVEFYLCGKDTDVYKAVENLKVGDAVDITGYLYWYNGMNPHVTAIEAAGIMSYEEYTAAELDTAVTVETYVQAKQSWWDNKATFYTQNEDGAYFLYEMACTKEQYDALVPGTKIRVNGFKAEWAGEVEITDAVYEVIPGSYIAEAQDVTALLGTDDLIGKQNQYVTFKGLTIAAYDEDGAAFAYKNAEEKTDDLYFKATLGENTYSFCVEFYLCGKDTDVYKAVEGLKVGDKVDITGYLYWYNGMNPHVTAIAKAAAEE